MTNIDHSTCNNCKECSTYTRTSFNANGDLLDNEYGLECNNCMTVKTIKSRKTKQLFIAYDYNKKIDSVECFKRMTYKKAVSLRAIKDFWCVVCCFTNKSYYVYINEYDKTVKLSEFDKYSN